MVDSDVAYDLYLSMKEQNASFGDLYKEGCFWAKINETIKNTLQTPDLQKLKNSAINRKFAGPDPANRQVYRALLNLYFKEIEKIDTAGFLSKHCEPAFGGEYDQELYPFPMGHFFTLLKNGVP
jgi:hypothetical protein